jgi:plastocyanin
MKATKKSTTYLTAALATAALIGLSGCGGSSDKTASNTTTPAPTSASVSTTTPSSSGSGTSGATKSSPVVKSAMITISNFDFGKPLTVSPGATVMVMNNDSETHTVTADTGGAFDVTATAGASTTFTAPTKPGSYPFHCSFHSDMHGSLTVK